MNADQTGEIVQNPWQAVFDRQHWFSADLRFSAFICGEMSCILRIRILEKTSCLTYGNLHSVRATSGTSKEVGDARGDLRGPRAGAVPTADDVHTPVRRDRGRRRCGGGA